MERWEDGTCNDLGQAFQKQVQKHMCLRNLNMPKLAVNTHVSEPRALHLFREKSHFHPSGKDTSRALSGRALQALQASDREKRSEANEWHVGSRQSSVLKL